MKIAVIGAGAAGLAALRHCVSNAYDDQVVCYEKTDQIGGTWVYREETGFDRYGLPIHTSMYKNLRTNLPKEVMGYPDYVIEDEHRSYVSRSEILKFLNMYCDHFQLSSHIQLLHHVELVEPAADRKWTVKVKDLRKNETVVQLFDAVMVCNGHYFEPRIPKINGQDIFGGEQLHSHDYRIPEIFNGKTVVILGAGPSGMDLALEISRAAKRVILSHRLTDTIRTVFPENVVQKTEYVDRLTEDEAIFTDNTREKVDVVFYCTGYKYSFPFLAESCGIRVDSNMVTPLWKHLVSIKNPTLALVGLPFYVCAFSMFDLQVRFVLRHWHGERQFPAKTDMLLSETEELAEHNKNGVQKRHFHMMGPKQGDYYKDLANIADITPLPPVLTTLHNDSSKRFLDDLVNYRQDRYKIINDNEFIMLK